MHKNMKVGDCLCGMAAKTGEIIISPDAGKDCRHTFVVHDTVAHGHIIVPLKTKDRVEGVLDLYMPANFEISGNTKELLTTIGYQLGIAIENARLYEKTEMLSLQDQLTGLWNHVEILRILGQELARAEREGTSVGVIMADIDYFKKVNDTYGHMAGDAVLSQVASRLLSNKRPYDAVGRYGGEEFMVVLPGCDGRCTLIIAERLRKCIADESMDTPEGAIPVTISIGLTSSGKINHDLNSLVKAADSALYQAKSDGRNRVQAAPKTVSVVLRKKI
jgi:diguanylate cyclase (GGDEF)-like protein